MPLNKKLSEITSTAAAQPSLITDLHGLGERKKWHWYNWIFSKPLDWGSTPIYIGTTINFNNFNNKNALGEVTFRTDFAVWQIWIAALLSVILIAWDRYETFRWRDEVPLRSAAVIFSFKVIFIQIITLLKPNEITFFMYIIIPIIAMVYFGERIGVLTGLIVWTVFACRVLYLSPEAFRLYQPSLYVNVFTVSLLFAMMMGFAMLKEKASRARSEKLLLTLARTNLQLEELAATRERNRLARDIHDSLGHYLTTINLLLGKAKAFKEKKPEEAELAIEDARRLTNDALQDVRESVRSLRTSHELFSLQRSLPLLVSSLQSEILRIEFELTGSEEGFSKQTLMVLYRVAQEGLTNVQRHASASRVKLQLHFEAAEVELLVEDDGRGFDPPSLQPGFNGGYGLAGLEERLEIIGGKFEMDSQPGQGTRLRAWASKNSSIIRNRSEPAYI